MSKALKEARPFAETMVAWQKLHGRHHLPWQNTQDPYRVWLSEIMLQQTQVKTVIPYFKNFIQKYPSQKKLSEASEDQILAAWSGLGFYRRARNIFASKEIIKKNFVEVDHNIELELKKYHDENDLINFFFEKINFKSYIKITTINVDLSDKNH